MVKVSVNRYVSNRIETIKKDVEASTERLRDKTIKNLEEVFAMAEKIAKGPGKASKSPRKNGAYSPQSTTDMAASCHSRYALDMLESSKSKKKRLRPMTKAPINKAPIKDKKKVMNRVEA